MSKGHKAGHLRIIGGAWRSRKVIFPINTDVRPTTDRTRETLFNWLQNHIAGSDCLDLFGGSGVLGLEALSRGAAHVTWVEREPKLYRHIQQQIENFSIRNAELVRGDSLAYLKHATRQFDIIFIDPPFDDKKTAEYCALLEQNQHLKDGALIYLECDRKTSPPELPPQWHVLKHKKERHVQFLLLQSSNAIAQDSPLKQ